MTKQNEAMGGAQPLLEQHTLGGRSLWYWQPGGTLPGGATPGAALPLVVMPSGEDAPEELAGALPLVEQAVRAGKCRPFLLACFASDDWNRDYSPWPAPALFGADAFAGGGPETLAWVRDALLPHAAARLGAPLQPHSVPLQPRSVPLQPQNTAILGYSLAGLFALWGFYESGLFGAAASCSGSLWFNGWDDYAAGRKAPQGSRVYLSLGEKEEKAKNPRMAAVGNATRALAATLAQDERTGETTLEWHPGGHFADVPRRIAQALIWLTKA